MRDNSADAYYFTEVVTVRLKWFLKSLKVHFIRIISAKQFSAEICDRQQL